MLVILKKVLYTKLTKWWELFGVNFGDKNGDFGFGLGLGLM